MKKLFITGITAISIAAFAQADETAHEHERHAACVADVTAKAEAAGETVKDAGAMCKCLGESIMPNPALLEEIDAAGGLPPKEEASDELKEVVEACIAADKAS